MVSSKKIKRTLSALKNINYVDKGKFVTTKSAPFFSQHRNPQMLKESSRRKFPISYSELSLRRPTPDSET